MNEVIKNNLMVKDLKQLSYSMYQTNDCFENEKKANECIESLTEHLQDVYEFISEDIWNLCEDNEVMSDCINKALIEKGIDVYKIGDIVNFLNTINIKENIKKESEVK